MSFWKTLGFSTVSAIDTLLDSGDYTLEQLLEEEEILQETKGQNRKLIEFLAKPESLRKLLTYITREPEEGADQKRKFKYPFLACEILASEVYPIIDAFYEHGDLLDQLYGILDREPPLNVMLASYSSRVAGAFLSKKVVDTIKYLKGKDKIINRFIVHLGNASVMDLLLKVIQSEDLADNIGTLEWLCQTPLIDSLVSKFDPSLPDEVHENASQALVDIISVSSLNSNSPLIAQLESEAVISRFLSFILTEKLNSSLFNGLHVLTELIRRHAQDSFDTTTTPETLPPILKLLTNNLNKFSNFLKIEGDNTTLQSSAVGPIVPLGFHRLKVIEFFATFVRTNIECVSRVIIESDIVSKCLDLFFLYPWNNFLHALVGSMVEGIIVGPDTKFAESLVTKSKLLEKIAKASVENEEAISKPKGFRRGYMGFIQILSTHLIEKGEKDPEFQKLLNEDKGWLEFIRPDGPYQTTRKRDNAAPVGSEEEEGEGQD